MKKSFNEIFENLKNKNEIILSQIYEDSKKEKKKRKALIKKFILLPTIIIIILFIYSILNKKYLFVAILSYWQIIMVVAYTVIVKKNTINYTKYKRKIKTNIISNLINIFFDNADFIPNKELSKQIYKEAGFNNYNEYIADDYIEGYLKQKNKITMANIKTISKSEDNSTVTFSGIFAKIDLNKSIDTSIKICNYKLKDSNTPKIELDSSNFEDIFDVNTNNSLKAMQLLTPDVMELLLNFSKFIKSKFDISIINNSVYIRINNNINFETNLDENNIIPKTELKKYYDTLNFIYNLSLFILNWIEESSINE